MKFIQKRIMKYLGVAVLVFALVQATLLGFYAGFIPDEMSCLCLENLPDFPGTQVSVTGADTLKDTISCTREAQYRFLGLLPVKSVALTTFRDLRLYPGGMPFGVKFYTCGVLVVGFCDVDSENGNVNPAYRAGLRLKDIITHIGGKEIRGAGDLTEAVENSDGKPLEITYSRGSGNFKATVTPVRSSSDGKYKTGIWVRDSGAGIGTVSFILPGNNYFAGLGHGICDADTGELLPIERGNIVGVTIGGITKGVSGTPGEIRGFFNSGKTGTLLGNSECGVYGIMAGLPADLPSEPLPIGLRSELKEGEATIYCTLDSNKIGQYTVMISDINRDATGGKCFTVKVTDPVLLEKTGGIIQGMSGSPIIQNGKIVGAVTHVLIGDPTTGFGIFVENMLKMIPGL